MKPRLSSSVVERDRYYESSSRSIRWLVMGMVVFTLPVTFRSSTAVFSLVGLVALYNLVQYVPRLHQRAFFTSRVNSIAVDHVFILALIILTGGLASPYYYLVLLLVITAIFTFGIAGFAIELAGQVILALALLWLPSQAPVLVSLTDFMIKLLYVVIFSLVAEQSIRTSNDDYLFASSFTRRVEGERQRLLSLINSLSSGVLAVDETGNVYLYNAAALELLNTNRDISGQSITDLLPLHTANEPDTHVNVLNLLTEGQLAVSRQDLIYVASDDSELILDLTISPVYVQAEGEPVSHAVGYMVVFRDITKQKTLDEERDEFISVTSHELRTPIAIAEANLSTALLPGYAKIDPKAETLVQQAYNNIIFLGDLIKDLATLSRAERGNLKVEKSLVNLKQLGEELARNYRPSAEAKDLKLELVLDTNLKQVFTSEQELREILQNFITNAVKYTEKGSVTLEFTSHAGAAVINVADTGIGLSTGDKAKIFQKYYRSEDYRTRQTGGTGLGLYITKKLAERLGMKIGFTSKLNHGSAFSVTIPYRVTTDEAAEIAVSAQA